MADKQVTTEDVLNDAGENLDLASLDPDNLPSDPEKLLELLNGKADADPKENEETDPTTDVNPQDSDPSTDFNQEEEAPVLSADGKHTIPFAVLRRERESRQTMEAENAALRKQLDELKLQPGQANPEIPDLDPEDPELKALEEEFPEIAKLNKATRAENQRLRQELNQFRDRVEVMTSHWERDQQQKQQAEVAQINTAIDANPTLRYLRDEGNELWKAAVEIDARLENSPQWRDKPIAERFAKVVERLEEDFGSVNLPASYQSSPVRDTQKPRPRATETEQQPRINTLSDLKGGSAPESPAANLENATAAEIGAMLQNIPYEQLSKMDPLDLLKRL